MNLATRGTRAYLPELDGPIRLLEVLMKVILPQIEAIHYCALTRAGHNRNNMKKSKFSLTRFKDERTLELMGKTDHKTLAVWAIEPPAKPDGAGEG
jgi:hypothetical protein